MKTLQRAQSACAAAVLACLCIFGLASAGYGNTDRVSVLISQLKDPDVHIRRGAVSALGKFKEPRTVAALIVALNDTDASVRQEAAAALNTPVMDASDGFVRSLPAIIVFSVCLVIVELLMRRFLPPLWNRGWRWALIYLFLLAVVVLVIRSVRP